MFIKLIYVDIKKLSLFLSFLFAPFIVSHNAKSKNVKYYFLSPSKIEHISCDKVPKKLCIFQLKNTKDNQKIHQAKRKIDICTCRDVEKIFDVIVIGGGHSGCEASHISAKSNAKTLLITQDIKSIGEMSCNPSIGGIGKGTLVKEIDALGGLMGKVIDKSGIHFKILNMKKGLAVRGHRAQADRDLYNFYMKKFIFATKKLTVIENVVQSLLIEKVHHVNNKNEHIKKVYGIKNQCGCEFYAPSVILTTGTFLGGVCHIGKKYFHGGRIKRMNIFTNLSDENNDSWLQLIEQEKEENNFIENQKVIEKIFNQNLELSTDSIAKQLKENNFEIKRMKTGTPPRLDMNSINFSILEKEETEKNNPFFFSFLNSNKENKNNTLPCYKTYTNMNTHQIVLQYMDELPDFDCHDKLGNGPRYCPSIAKKVTKFSHKKEHIIWLEPEGYNSNLIYPNGLSSAFPFHVQKKIINSIKGLEEARIIFPAYDVEYYFVNPTCLDYNLETKQVSGLFLVGQICGTTGYEEAACQGIIAGINAAIHAKTYTTKGKENNTHDEQNKEKYFLLKRSSSYIGVLIHDLIHKGVSEPYRIFTSRAEYRLLLRPDNADIRLTPLADKLGIVSKERMEILRNKYSSVNKLIYVFKKVGVEEKGSKKQKHTEDQKEKGQEKNQEKYQEKDQQKDQQKDQEMYQEKKKEKNSKNSGNITVAEKNAIDSLNDFRLYFLSAKEKKKKITLYDILKSGREYKIDVLLSSILNLQYETNFFNCLSFNDLENNLKFYLKKCQDDPYFLKSELFLINLTNIETACAEVKYSSYLKKQIKEIKKVKNNLNITIPTDITYNRVNFPYLSNEEIEKLNKIRPKSLLEANNIEGVTTSAIFYLYHYIRNGKKTCAK